MQPEDMTYLLNSYFSEMSKIALEYGATIDKFIGDAILIFFGDPETRGVQEDALQCVRMAVAMQRRMRELRGVWRDKGYRQPFQVRIGINTGFCNVGNFGSAQRMDYTVIGSEVNLAARLEQNGEPDGVIMSYETYALVKEEFDAEEGPPLTAKGVSREIRCFVLQGVQGSRRGAGRTRCTSATRACTWQSTWTRSADENRRTRRHRPADWPSRPSAATADRPAASAASPTWPKGCSACAPRPPR
jgi:adenylate cyclase